VAAAAVVVTVLILAGSVSATPVTQSPTSQNFTAPYGGHELRSLTMYSTGCGNSVVRPVPPLFNLSTGVAVMSLNSTSRPCQGSISNTSIYALIGMETDFFQPLTRAAYEFSASWSFLFNFDLVARSNSTGPAFAFYQLLPEAELTNQNGSKVWETGSDGHIAMIQTGKFAQSYDLFTRVDVGRTLTPVRGQSWAFATFLYINILTTGNVGSDFARASISLSAGANETTLDSYSISITPK
jgi:hypothetical protein